MPMDNLFGWNISERLSVQEVLDQFYTSKKEKKIDNYSAGYRISCKKNWRDIRPIQYPMQP